MLAGQIANVAPVMNYNLVEQPVMEKLAKHKKSSQSLRSMGSSGSQSGRFGKALRESFSRKMVHIQFIWIALVSNAMLLWIGDQMISKQGLYFPTGGAGLARAFPILMTIWMHISAELTAHAIHDAFNVFGGYLLSRKKGYSIAICGFTQASGTEKITFGSKLAYKSGSKALLEKVSYIWLLLYLMMILPLFAPIYIHKKEFQTSGSRLHCIEYEEKGTPLDRKWPNLENAMGTAEILFTKSLGYPRTEMDNPKVDFGIYLFPPQLLDAASEHSSIRGAGFTTNIRSRCSCASSTNDTDLIDAGVPISLLHGLAAAYQSLGSEQGMVNSMEMNGTEMGVIITIFSGVEFCGGSDHISAPVCKTQLFDHRHIIANAEFMTDGYPSSIALKKATIISDEGPADVFWAYNSLKSVLGGQLSIQKLPKIFPGCENPLLWWTTVNLQYMSYSLIEPGLETMFGIILRGGMQRTLKGRATECSELITDIDRFLLTIDSTGYYILTFFAAMHMVFTLLALVATIPWFVSQAPISPAIRLMGSRTYFLMMIAKRIATDVPIDALRSNMESVAVWPTLDCILRVGEAKTTSDDPDIGRIVLDKPKLVSGLTYTKSYT